MPKNYPSSEAKTLQKRVMALGTRAGYGFDFSLAHVSA